MDFSELDLGRFETLKERTDFLTKWYRENVVAKTPEGEEPPTFSEWVGKQGISGRYESDGMEIYRHDVAPKDDPGIFGNMQLRDPFPQALGLTPIGISDEQYPHVRGWTMWADLIGVDRNIILFLDTMLMSIALMLYKFKVCIRTEWLESSVESIRAHWTPKWDWALLPNECESDRQRTIWCIDHHSYVVNNNGFRTQYLLHDWIRNRARRNTYDNLKRLGHIVSVLVHETSPLLENSAKYVLAAVDYATRMQFHCEIRTKWDKDSLLMPYNKEPEIYMNRMFCATMEEQGPDGEVVQKQFNTISGTDYFQETIVALKQAIEAEMDVQDRDDQLVREQRAAEFEMGINADRNNNNEVVDSESQTYRTRLMHIESMISQWVQDPEDWPQFEWHTPSSSENIEHQEWASISDPGFRRDGEPEN